MGYNLFINISTPSSTFQLLHQHFNAVQVLTWGVRHMKKFQLAAVNSPSIEIECGGVVLSTIKIKNAKKNPNFDTSSMLFDVVSLHLLVQTNLQKK